MFAARSSWDFSHLKNDLLVIFDKNVIKIDEGLDIEIYFSKGLLIKKYLVKRHEITLNL